MKQQHAQMQGFIRAVAEQTHPFQTRLSLIITDFEPNRNKQGIPQSEAENILRFALNTPLKINFDGEFYSGHAGAKAIGPITNVYMAEDNGKQVIAGDAIIWNDIHEDIADHLKAAFAEGVGTSWEIYYEDSNVDEQGVEWLQGCVFAGTCIVETPAYGPTRTRLLAIAEALNQESRLMANEQTLESTDTSVTDVPAQAASVNEVDTLRTDLAAALDALGNIYSGLYEMLDQSYELETQLVTTDLSAVAEQFTKLVAGIQKRFESLQTQANNAVAALAQYTAEKLLEARSSELASVGINIEDRKDFYLSLSETDFTIYIEDLKKVAKPTNRSESSTNVAIPDVSTNEPSHYSIKELAALFK
jgi:hypothetical protein